MYISYTFLVLVVSASLTALSAAKQGFDKIIIEEPGVEPQNLRSIENIEENNNEKNGVEPTCPFVADEYDLKMRVGGSEIDMKFSPRDLGLASGYYCSLATDIGSKT